MKLDDLWKQCEENNYSRVAVTNHGNIINMPKIITEGAKRGVQVIPGCELYVTWDYPRSVREKDKLQMYHMVALAKNQNGYKNLIRLVSEGHLTGRYFKPRVDKELIEEYKEDIIFLSACLNGVLNRKYTKEGLDKEDVKKNATWLKEVLDGQLYLELQRHPKLEAQDPANAMILETAAEYELPVVATCDSHYAYQEHHKAWCTMMTLAMSMKPFDAANDYYVKSPQQMKELFADIPEAIENTVRIADICEPITFDSSYKFPVFDTGKLSEKEYLKQKAYEGLNLKLAEHGITQLRKKYEERLEHELDIIHGMGFDGYMLVVSDFVTAAKDRDIPVGAGRGSAAGSLVCWVMNITDVDPIKYGLLFERFLNPDRISMPDIDVDFGDVKRDQIIQYVEDKYGHDKVAQIMTIGTMAAKGSIRDACRVVGVSYTDTDALAKAIPEGVRGQNVYLKTITDPDHADYSESFMKLANSRPDYKEALETAVVLEGMTRSTGVHAAGVVISDDKPLLDHIGLMLDKDENVVTTDDMKVLEKLIGLIKFDFLGLSTLTTIEKACEFIKINHGVDIDIDKIPLDDTKTYDMLCSGDLMGVFQLSGSGGFREVVMQIQPRNIEEIADITSLYRPGPLDNGFIPKYVKAKNTGNVEYMVQVGNKRIQEEIEKILQETKGVLIYQEQVMKLVQIMAGYTLSEADILRRIMGKKIPSEMEEQRGVFVEGCLKNAISKGEANKAFDAIAKFAEYGFNKSHAIAYSLISYQTAYLRAHYPIEFMAASLSEVAGKRDKTISFLNDCKTSGIKVLPPSINDSHLAYTPTHEGIRFGLGAIKSLGDVAVDCIIRARKKGEFKNIIDFCSRVDLKKVNTAKIQTLIRAGCFDEVA
jgi:DNA polymerase-3 subunit alpha